MSAQFDPNAKATTVSTFLTLVKWILWIIAGGAWLLAYWYHYETGDKASAIFIAVIGGVFWLGGKGVEYYHNSVIVNTQETDNKEIIAAIGEDEFAEVEELEVRVQKIKEDAQLSIEQYFNEGGIDDETADKIIEAKKRTKDDIDKLELHHKMEDLNRKIAILDLYLECHVDALGKAAQLYREGRTPATVKRFYQNEVSNNISGTLLETFTQALFAKNIGKAMIRNFKKDPNLQMFDTKEITNSVQKQIKTLDLDKDLTIAKLVRML